MSNLIVAATFTESSGQPATGLALADIDLYLTRQDKSTGVISVVWDGTQNPTVEVTNIGMYARIYGAADFDTYAYFARATYTGATVLDIDHVTGAVDSIQMDETVRQEVADETLERGVDNTEATAHEFSLTAIVLAALQSAQVGVNWTIYETDGVTVFANRTLTLDAAADPIIQVE